ncbi:putative bicarbonate transporter, IctB family [Cyanobacterium stanieri LEGE 03274]|uniref:Bicarbonate transporter, IctB family n=1 Tax=Cyanobacterium stanieri LEGE 03274 TaxID=1828756 RepID=A0ABR9V4P4_9CHRO|nr:IctB family putative bicarbonate transporter [Cyanobacterium stanieri]MBE9222842.1 putative bicarbonate transporter, IctB family [Cyanobacterium stanieri LEGE 03274]
MNTSVSNPLSQWRKTSLIGKSVGLLSNWYHTSYLLQYSDAIASILICILIILAPFSSTTLIGIILVAIGGFWLLLTLAETNPNQITAIHLWIFFYWLASIISTAFSPLKSASLSGLIKFTLYLLFFALCARVFQKKKFLELITTTYLLISLIVSGYGIRQKFIGVTPLATWTDTSLQTADLTRVYSYLGNPNLLGGYLLPAVAFGLGGLILWKTLPQKALAIVIVVTNSTCIYFTGSRGAWLALVALLFTFLLGLNYWWAEYLSPFWRKWLVPIIVGIFSLFIITAIILVEPLRLRILSIFSWRGDSSNNFRINVWYAVFQMMRDYPITGIGLGNQVFNQIYPLYMKTNFTALSSYSIFLEIPIETGIIGISLFMGILVSTFKKAITKIQIFKTENQAMGIWIIASLAALVGLATQGVFDTVWFRPQINTLWWLLIGVIASNVRVMDN